MNIGLTLGVSEYGEDIIKGCWGQGLLECSSLKWGSTKPGWVSRRWDGVEAARGRGCIKGKFLGRLRGWGLGWFLEGCGDGPGLGVEMVLGAELSDGGPRRHCVLRGGGWELCCCGCYGYVLWRCACHLAGAV